MNEVLLVSGGHSAGRREPRRSVAQGAVVPCGLSSVGVRLRSGHSLEYQGQGRLGEAHCEDKSLY